MPGWSTEIANEFIKMAAAEGNDFSQMHLQELVYIAHGWCLALTGEPLTGDRPEAQEHGPEYRRLADALAGAGTDAVAIEIDTGRGTTSKAVAISVDEGGLGADERAIMAQIYASYGPHCTSELATLTRADDTPWAEVYARGRGKGRDISHRMVRDQFADREQNRRVSASTGTRSLHTRALCSGSRTRRH